MWIVRWPHYPHAAEGLPRLHQILVEVSKHAALLGFEYRQATKDLMILPLLPVDRDQLVRKQRDVLLALHSHGAKKVTLYPK